LIAGNCKADIYFLPAAPSLKQTLRGDSKHFKKVITDKSSQPPQYQPWNVRQVTCFKSAASTSSKIGRDEFLALHELAYMIPGFVWTISTFPDLVVTCGLQFMCDLVQKSSIILMSYDTTFNPGDFHVSVLVAQVGSFVQQPVIPVAFVIHEKKFQSVHTEFLDKLKTHFSAAFQPIISLTVKRQFSRPFVNTSRVEAAFMLESHFD
jgi:hypothetical protein